MNVWIRRFLASSALATALPAAGASINTIGAAPTAGAANCSTSAFAPPVQSAGAISFDRATSRPAGNGACGLSYSARAGAGSVGVGVTMSGEKTGGSDQVSVSATTRFDLDFVTPEDWVKGTLVDVSVEALLTGQLQTVLQAGANGFSSLRGTLFVQGSFENQSVSDTRNTPLYVVNASSPNDTLNVAQTFGTNTIGIDPLNGVTVSFSLTAEVGAFTNSNSGEYLNRVGALDSLGFRIGQQIFEGLPAGVQVADDLALGIQNGLYVGAPIPLPAPIVLLLSGLAATAAAGRRRRHRPR